MINSTLAERFWSKVNLKGPYPDVVDYPKLKTRCWLWTGCVDRDGYGLCNVHVAHKTERAHRVAYRLRYGKFPSHKKVLHACDTPGCMRHLFLGTIAINNRDRKEKGRNGNLPGELSPSPKLTDAKAIRIRKLYATGEYTQQAIADAFKVTRSNISYILARKTFRHI